MDTYHIFDNSISILVSARIQNNLTANEDAEKGSAQLEVPKLELKLTQTQFKFVARFFEKIERIKRKGRFNKYLPKESAKTNPRAWWKFAFHAVKKQYDIERKCQLFSRSYSQGRDFLFSLR